MIGLVYISMLALSCLSSTLAKTTKRPAETTSQAAKTAEHVKAIAVIVDVLNTMAIDFTPKLPRAGIFACKEVDVYAGNELVGGLSNATSVGIAGKPVGFGGPSSVQNTGLPHEDVQAARRSTVQSQTSHKNETENPVTLMLRIRKTYFNNGGHIHVSTAVLEQNFHFDLLKLIMVFASNPTIPIEKSCQDVNFTLPASDKKLTAQTDLYFDGSFQPVNHCQIRLIKKTAGKQGYFTG